MPTSRVQTTIISRTADNTKLFMWVLGLGVWPFFVVTTPLQNFGAFSNIVAGAVFSSWGATILGFIGLLVKRHIQWRARVQESINTLAKGEPRHMHVAGGAKSGIALGADTLLILNGKTVYSVPLDIIRGWEWKVEGYDRVTVSGFGPGIFGAALQAGAQNTSAKYQAEQASGLFIRVASIDHPVIHFQTTDVKLLQRWHEILLQTLGDEFSEQQVA